MAPDDIGDFDADHMNSRVAGMISRYWHRQGYVVRVGVYQGPVWSDLRNGLPRGYRGEDAIELNKETGRARWYSSQNA